MEHTPHRSISTGMEHTPRRGRRVPFAAGLHGMEHTPRRVRTATETSTVRVSVNAKWKTMRLVLRMQERSAEQFDQGLASLHTDFSRMNHDEMEAYVTSKFDNFRKAVLDGINAIEELVRSENTASKLSPDHRERFVLFLRWVTEILRLLKGYYEQVMDKVHVLFINLWEVRHDSKAIDNRSEAFVEDLRRTMMATQRDISRMY